MKINEKMMRVFLPFFKKAVISYAGSLCTIAFLTRRAALLAFGGYDAIFLQARFKYGASV